MPFFQDIISVFFPRTCLGCGNVLIPQEEMICVGCRHKLPFTNNYRDFQNGTFRLFLGRCDIVYAMSLLYFEKNSLVQTLLHNMKYHNHPKLGILFGQWTGEALKTLENKKFDVVVPVPVSKQRLRKRGYNQTALFSEHIAKTLCICVDYNVLIKPVDTPSQVLQKGAQRKLSSESIFDITSHALTGKHVLLVDDVITTGSTLEACVKTLQKTPDIRISIATIAMAR